MPRISGFIGSFSFSFVSFPLFLLQAETTEITEMVFYRFQNGWFPRGAVKTKVGGENTNEDNQK
jgi:hypothetical protein